MLLDVWCTITNFITSDLWQQAVCAFVEEQKNNCFSLSLEILIGHFVGHPLRKLVQIAHFAEKSTIGRMMYFDGVCT